MRTELKDTWDPLVDQNEILIPIFPASFFNQIIFWIYSIKTNLPLLPHLKHKISDMWEIGGKIWLSSSYISKSRNCHKWVLSPSQKHFQYRCFSLCDLICRTEVWRTCTGRWRNCIACYILQFSLCDYIFTTMVHV